MACGNIARNFDNYLRTGLPTQPILNPKVPGSLVDLSGLPGRQTFNKNLAQEHLVRLLPKDGATAIIHFMRKDAPVHFLNAKNINGEVWIFDAHEGVAFSTKDPEALLKYIEPGDPVARPQHVVSQNGVSIAVTSP